MVKYDVAFAHTPASPPSHMGSHGLIEHPITVITRPAITHTVSDCLNTLLAFSVLLAPMQCATCTAKPVAIALATPLNSQVVVEMMPMAAESSAPSWPTIEASIYCMATFDTCAMMAGMLNWAVRLSCWPRVISSPLRIFAISDVSRSLAIRCVSYALTDIVLCGRESQFMAQT